MSAAKLPLVGSVPFNLKGYESQVVQLGNSACGYVCLVPIGTKEQYDNKDHLVRAWDTMTKSVAILLHNHPFGADVYLFLTDATDFEQLPQDTATLLRIIVAEGYEFDEEVEEGETEEETIDYWLSNNTLEWLRIVPINHIGGIPDVSGVPIQPEEAVCNS